MDFYRCTGLEATQIGRDLIWSPGLKSKQGGRDLFWGPGLKSKQGGRDLFWGPGLTAIQVYGALTLLTLSIMYLGLFGVSFASLLSLRKCHLDSVLASHAIYIARSPAYCLSPTPNAYAY